MHWQDFRVAVVTRYRGGGLDSLLRLHSQFFPFECHNSRFDALESEPVSTNTILHVGAAPLETRGQLAVRSWGWGGVGAGWHQVCGLPQARVAVRSILAGWSSAVAARGVSPGKTAVPRAFPRGVALASEAS